MVFKIMEQRYSDNETSKRDIPSFIEPRPPLIQNPFMRPRPQKGINLLELFEEDSEIDEPELVQVYLRMKPCKTPSNLYEVRSDKCLVTSLDTATAGHGRRTQHNVSRMYTFSKIFEAQCSQKEIFEEVVKENLKKLPEGHSFTLLAYGASGSGKTYTLMGNVGSPGLIPRSLEYLFKMVDAAQLPLYKPSDGGGIKLGYTQQELELQWVKRLRHVSAPQRDKYRRMSAQLHNDFTVSNLDLANRTQYYVWVSFVEIYNEAIYDLLAPPDKRTKLRIREDSTGQVYVKDVIQAFVKSGEEAYDVMVAGKHNLVVAATGVHAQSSRSHCIFTITMLTETDGAIRQSCVRLCDLAGCERARATGNTGARMQESRAINSSLLVLERCLRMLRRNQKQAQEAIVPYRESKLTRLLGSGLSGSRGETVSMVVTLNPAPQYAHETKHVLSLAVVARDIQTNNTVMFASSLESSAQDTTVSTSSAEVMKLRADNELLHFELVQAQARNRELLAAMDEQQEQSSKLMRECVEETKDMTRQYYQAQLDALRAEMEEKIQEYEARLAEAAASTRISERFTQPEVHLMTENADSEEKIEAEKTARAHAENVEKHLRTTSSCIDERNEEAESESDDQDEVVIIDSEGESDPLNQSLEPVFRMKSMNISQVAEIQKLNDYQNDCGKVNVDEESDMDKSAEFNKDSEYETGNESEVNDAIKDTNEYGKILNSPNDDNMPDMMCNNVKSMIGESHIEKNMSSEFEHKFAARGTYFVKDTKMQDTNDIKSSEEVIGDVRQPTQDINESRVVQPNEKVKDRSTYYVGNYIEGTEEVNRGIRQSTQDISDDRVLHADKKENARGTYFVRNSAPDSSYDEEQDDAFELEVKEISILKENSPEERLIKSERKPKKISETLSKIMKSLNSQNYSSDSSLRQFEQLEMASEKCSETIDRKSLLDDMNILTKNKLYFDDNDKLHSKIENPEAETFIISNQTKDFEEILEKGPSIDPPSLKSTNQSIDFEENKSSPGEILIQNPVFEKRTYFENIDVNIGIMPHILVTDIKNVEKLPSIDKQGIDRCESRTMKLLLGEDLTKNDMLSEHNNKAFLKKHESIDVFEGLDSPVLVKAKERENDTAAQANTIMSNIDKVRQSIERLVLEQDTRKSYKQKVDIEPKTEPLDSKESENKVAVEYQATKYLDVTQPLIPDNTIDEFESIYKKLSVQRPTQFDLLVQDIDASNANEGTAEQQSTQESSVEVKLEEKDVGIDNDKQKDPLEEKDEEVKYNLRHRGKSNYKSVLNVNQDKKVDIDKETEEILAESSAKCESKKYAKKSLRLRRRKNQDDDNSDQDDKNKLMDILNLKKEFSDVTLGLPASKKVVNDIPSPEKLPGEEENLPPILGIQSCPSKSVTRSRRKLFTPRAEPLEESLSQTGDSHERVYVPRPSYHRTRRVRRKL